MENDLTEFLNQNCYEKYKVGLQQYQQEQCQLSQQQLPQSMPTSSSIRGQNLLSSDYESIRLAFMQQRQQQTTPNQQHSSNAVLSSTHQQQQQQRNPSTTSACPKLIDIKGIKANAAALAFATSTFRHSNDVNRLPSTKVISNQFGAGNSSSSSAYASNLNGSNLTNRNAIQTTLSVSGNNIAARLPTNGSNIEINNNNNNSNNSSSSSNITITVTAAASQQNTNNNNNNIDCTLRSIDRNNEITVDSTITPPSSSSSSLPMQCCTTSSSAPTSNLVHGTSTGDQEKTKTANSIRGIQFH